METKAQIDFNTKVEDKVKTYKFITYPGNHSEIIAEALKKRGNFEEV